MNWGLVVVKEKLESLLKEKSIVLSQVEILFMCDYQPTQESEFYDTFPELFSRFSQEDQRRELLQVIAQSYDRSISCNCNRCKEFAKSSA